MSSVERISTLNLYWLFLGLFLMFSVSLLAQGDALTSLELELSDGYVGWSSNGETVAFQVWDDNHQATLWAEVDLYSHTVTLHDDYPLNPVIDPEDAEFFDVSPVSFVSPDGNLLFYTKPFSQIDPLSNRTYTAHQYAIANLETYEIFETGILGAQVSEESLHIYKVVWSANSRNLVFETTGLSPYSEDVRIFHINIEDETDLQASSITEFDQIEMDDEVYDAVNPFAHGLVDMSNNGDRVLIYAALFDYQTDIYTQPVVLIEWIPDEVGQSHIIWNTQDLTEFRSNPHYSPIDDRTIFYWQFPTRGQWAEAKLYLGNLATDEQVLLWESLFPVISAYFSPYGCCALLINEEREVFLLDLQKIFPPLADSN